MHLLRSTGGSLSGRFGAAATAASSLAAAAVAPVDAGNRRRTTNDVLPGFASPSVPAGASVSSSSYGGLLPGGRQGGGTSTSSSPFAAARTAGTGAGAGRSGLAFPSSSTQPELLSIMGLRRW